MFQKLCFRWVFICIFFLLSVSSISSQNIDSLVESVYNKQESLLIRNEIRKRMGDRANDPAIKEIVKSLRVWAAFESMPPEEFAAEVERFVILKDYGFNWEETEELIPYFITAKPSKKDIPYLGKFFKEMNLSKVSEDTVLEILRIANLKKWSGASVLVAGRLVVLSRKKESNSKLTLNNLESNLPKQFENLSDEKKNKFFKNWYESSLGKIDETHWEAIKTDSMQLSSKSVPMENFQISERRTEIIWNEQGEWVTKERPKLDPNVIFMEEQTLDPKINSSSEKDKRKLVDPVGRQWIGTPYLYGGYSRRGVDCSGLTKSILTDSKIGMNERMIPRSARDQAQIGKSVSRDRQQIGNLVFFSASPNTSKITHVGMVLDNGNFIHASTSRGVVIQSLNEKWWKERYVTGRDIFTVGK
ncbi:C40 family peptidase [Leptospira sp. 2 VSF19]|uniref:C40 family peptidase n=1 Tax=Leptospira soteropolitanensis TaxID=2950025 RepID=A0AAW5VL29_9LEPT|nr:C40 family peptidase [Leptospira soteropolitanensis]MCW7492391.1 C40 family peptidase [Leptospira soteropolitanensis]MCW7499971.1 C40 family peptidase [Leptospira soteropolitanensis]MCW7522223.1 C40 family peptidase [Leptospira soteropolitanensis]MCW7526078.1 C40 family peptidase [Leptospira soteropolitanensis]MCW7529810.1 C40 family peptidase [Leptospira soteropolitanensis]